MSAFVLVADRQGTRPGTLDAYRYGTVQATLPTGVNYFGAPTYVWQMPDMLAAEVQADRLASGGFVALPFSTLLGVQERVNNWRVDCQ